MAGIILDIEQKESFEVTDKSGRVIGTIEFNSRDLNIVNRLKEAYKNIRDYEDNTRAEAEKIEGLTDKSAGIDEVIEAVDFMAEKESFLHKQIDYAFNSPISAVVFKEISAFTPINGKQYFEIFMDAVISVVEKNLKKERKAFEERTKKYTAKYMG